MLTLKNWYYLSYKGHFHLCVQWDFGRLQRLLEVTGGSAELQHVKADSRVAVHRYEYDVRSMDLSS